MTTSNSYKYWNFNPDQESTDASLSPPDPLELVLEKIQAVDETNGGSSTSNGTLTSRIATKGSVPTNAEGFKREEYRQNNISQV